MQADKSQNSPDDQNASTNYDQDAQKMPPDIGTVSRWLAMSNVVYIIAAVVAVLATFGVVYFGNRYTRLKERELDAYKSEADARIAEANKNSADANAAAAAARADAEAARTEQDKLKNESLKLEVRLREMEEAQSKLGQTNAEAQEKIAKLEEEKQPRTISNQQSTQIINLLKPFAGETVEVRLYSQVTEAVLFSNQVCDILEKAGIKTSRMNMMGAAGTGFGVAIHDANSVPPIANAIFSSFRAAGLLVGGLLKPDMVAAGKFFIFIGEKPLVP
jgi:hypothetical protein